MPSLLPNSGAQTPGAEAEWDRRVAFPRSRRFDFSKGEFALTPRGAVSESRETEAWLQWCRKALLTDRYKHLVYGRTYGREFSELLSRGLTKAGTEAEIVRMVRDCLLVDRRTSAVTDFSFRWAGDGVEFTCRVTSTRADTGTLSGKVVVE